MRAVVLTIALAFIGVLAALTGVDLAKHGPSVVDVLALLIVVLFLVGIVGALRHPPA